MDLALAETASHDPLGRLAKLQPKPVFGTLLRRTGRQHRGKACAWWAVSAYALSQVQCRELHLRSIGVISNQESCQNIPVWSREGSGCPRYWSSPDSSCLRSDNNLTSTCTEFNVSLLSSWIFLVSVSLFFYPTSRLPFRKQTLWQLPSGTRNLYLSMHYNNYNNISTRV